MGAPEVFAVESCIHDRHIKPQIFADLTGENWRLDEYEKREGYFGLRQVLGLSGSKKLEPEEVIAEIKDSNGSIKTYMIEVKPKKQISF